MGSNYFAQHAWGIDLEQHGPELAQRAADMLRIANEIEGMGSVKEWEENNDPDDSSRAMAASLSAARAGTESWDEVPMRLLREEVSKALLQNGIQLPARAQLIWTGEEDSHPGRCHTAPDSVIVGFGMLRNPRRALKVPKSFADKAEHKMWVLACY